jgi:hypothetical protein
MVRLQVHRYAMRMEHPFEGICHLLPDPFLDSEPFGEKVYESCQLGDAEYIFVRDVADVGIAEEGESMMLA